MKNQIVLELGDAVPPALVAELPKLPGLRVQTGGRQPLLRANGQQWRLLVQPPPMPAADVERALHALLQEASLVDDSVLPLVVDTVLPQRLRSALEQQEISYLDGRRALHVVAPGVIVHIERRDGDRHKAPQAGNGLGVVGVRAVQSLLGAPRAAWTVTDLAAAGDVSIGQAHKVLVLLQREGLVAVAGSGPLTYRTVRDPRLLLEWLAAQRAARRVREQLACALYANTLPRLCAKVTQTLDGGAVSHAWTAAAAAALQQVGPTSVPRATVRVDPERTLQEVAALIGALPTDRGANVLLWRDVGRVGIHGASRHSSGDTAVPLAPPVRVYLDLLGERRGEDLAVHYRETILGY